ncbi:tRNA (5-methylaminomethyl-2-thiouridine)(34)-methyltransferase MnmD [Mangrovibacterium sp.]|uniref:tRNA (5-methylaminomethyl-2-thiouridine)(34)-methyltransferase MnmD n=1 Tax=Mangrovibacterium sp. TaxID=1961364 RepID=UPI0035614989
MERKIILTADGSQTFFVPELNEHFHSVHGAIQESMHVFITSGLMGITKDEICIFEVGFGTGLNALLTLANKKPNQRIRYFTIEKYPLKPDEYNCLDYPRQIDPKLEPAFQLMLGSEWNLPVQIEPNFEFTKFHDDLTNFDFHGLPLFDLIYFDAFAPGKQQEMWTDALFSKLAAHTKAGGIFVTYCAQGEVRRSLIRSGFNMKRIQGPPGKKEMLFGEKCG